MRKNWGCLRHKSRNHVRCALAARMEAFANVRQLKLYSPNPNELSVEYHILDGILKEYCSWNTT